MRQIPLKLGLAACLSLAILLPASGPAAGMVSAGAKPSQCAPDTTYSVSGRAVGYNYAGVVSRQLAGPGSINYSQSATSTQGWTHTGNVTVDIGFIIAKASAAYSLAYSTSTSETDTYQYNTTIPAGKTGVQALLHRKDRITTTKAWYNANCTGNSSNFYTYLPVASTANITYCLIRDLYPYGYTAWRALCTGE